MDTANRIHIHPYRWISMDLSMNLSMDLSMDLSMNLSMNLSMDLSMDLSMNLSMDLSMDAHGCPWIYPYPLRPLVCILPFVFVLLFPGAILVDK